MFKNLQSSLGTAWCHLAHDSVMWPVHGHYECRACGRQYPAFAEASASAARPDPLAGAQRANAGPAAASLSRA
jgi:hypothetical protein